MMLLALYAILILAMLFYAGANITRPWLNRAYILSVVTILAGNVILLLPLLSLPDLHCGKPMVITGAFVCLMLYSVDFLTARSKTLQGYLLLAMLVFFVLYALNTFYHFPYRQQVGAIGGALIIINLVYGVYLNYKGE